MRITEKLARYIITLQTVYDVEVGLNKDDFQIRNKLEKEFPVLKEERDNELFHSWLWAVRVEQEPEVKELRELLDLASKIPFDEVYYADVNIPEVDPNAPGTTYSLYRDGLDVVSELLMDRKGRALKRLQTQDTSGKLSLRKEWEIQRGE